MKRSTKFWIIVGVLVLVMFIYIYPMLLVIAPTVLGFFYIAFCILDSTLPPYIRGVIPNKQNFIKIINNWIDGKDKTTS